MLTGDNVICVIKQGADFHKAIIQFEINQATPELLQKYREASRTQQIKDLDAFYMIRNSLKKKGIVTCSFQVAEKGLITGHAYSVRTASSRIAIT